MDHFYIRHFAVFFIISVLGICNVVGQKIINTKKIIQSTNINTLNALRVTYEAKSLQKRKHAEQLAKKFGWKIKSVDANGNLMELQEVTALGNPKYYVTHGGKPFNLTAANTTKTNSLWTGGNLGLDLNGEGMHIGTWDGGAVRFTHQEFDSNDLQSDDALTISNHATHVAGTIVGLGVNPVAKGMASEASLLAYDWNSDEAEMAKEAANGLLVSNHSYGWSSLFLSTWEFGYYDSQAAAWDAIQYNAPYYLAVKSAGNDQHDFNFSKKGYDLVNGASTSKNTLVVAGVENVTVYNEPLDVVMSGFSSWGPTDDGRIKPDISAMGVRVFSAYGTEDDHYSTLSGTSMAAPNTAGSLILLQQHYNNLHGVFMKASTLKAVVINTAEEAGNTPGPDYKFGWGLLNAEAAALLISNENVSAIIEEGKLDDGDSITLKVTSDGLTPLSAHLVWTDPAGTPGPVNVVDNPLRMLVNDLDLRITGNGEMYEPWVLDPDNPSQAAINGDNITDNVEGITVNFPDAGDYFITISHKGALRNGFQEFSLVVKGINVGLPPVCEVVVPEDLVLKNITDSAATISWSTSAPVVSYNYRYRQKGTKTWTTLVTTTNAADLTGLIAGTDYEFQVRSNCNTSSSEYSVIFGFVTASIPSFCEVTSFSNVPVSDITDKSVRLTWAKVVGAISFNYRFRQPGIDGWVDRNTKGNTVTLSGLKENTTYEYQVQTVCDNAKSAYTDLASFTTGKSARDTPTPCNMAPANLTTSSSDNTAYIHWSPVIDVVDYQYRYRPTAGGRWIHGKSSKNEISLTGLAPQTNYHFHLRTRCGSNSPIAKVVFATQSASGRQADNQGLIKRPATFEEELLIYPNPASNQLWVALQSFSSEAQVLIYDLKGTKLIENTTDTMGGEINITTLPPGMYFLRIITSRQSIATHFIKK